MNKLKEEVKKGNYILLVNEKVEDYIETLKEELEEAKISSNNAQRVVKLMGKNNGVGILMYGKDEILKDGWEDKEEK